MSNVDDIFWRRFGLVLGLLATFALVVAFIARGIAGDALRLALNSPSVVSERIAPTGSVRVGDPSKVVAAAPAAVPAAAAATPAAASSGGEGESVFNSVCTACHTAGVAGAPKLGDAEAWKPRIAQGEDALLHSVLNGKGAMPPKGGNPALTENQVRAAIEYMVGKASPGGSAATGAMAKVEQAAGAAKEAAGKAMEQASSAVAGAAGAAKEMASAAADKATGAAMAAAAPATGDGKPGEEVYNMGCVACHATGAANAPKVTDKEAWAPRAATGMDALLHSALNGKGAMPPKGGLTSLTDADVRNAIQYMLKTAGVEAGN